MIVRLCGLVISFVAAAFSGYAYAMKDKERRVIIDHTLISIIDGTPRINIGRILQLENGIKKLREGDDSGKIRVVYQGKVYTTKQLVVLEKAYQQKNPTQYDKKKPFKNALESAIGYFIEIANAYLEENIRYKDQMCTLINHWAAQRNVDSILTQWGEQEPGEEFEQLKRLANSFEKFDKFLEQLETFLKDFRYSVPKSTQIFKKAAQKKSGTGRKKELADEL